MLPWQDMSYTTAFFFILSVEKSGKQHTIQHTENNTVVTVTH